MSNLLPTIASGLNGWLTYEFMLRNGKYHEEATFYPCITAIGRAQGYVVHREFSLPMALGQRGSPKKVDFLMYSRIKKEFWLIEVKFKKPDRKMAGSLSEDAKKILNVSRSDINRSRKNKRYASMPLCTTRYKLNRVVMIIWRGEDIIGHIKENEDIRISHQLISILRNMFDKPKTVTSRMLANAFLSEVPLKQVTHKLGSLRFGGTKTPNRYWVAALRETKSWAKIP